MSECDRMKQENERAKEALRRARHQLVTTHGLLVADGKTPDDTWTLDNSLEVACIDAVSGVPSSGDVDGVPKWQLVLTNELADTRAKLKTAVEALEYYAAQPPQHAYYIVEAKDRSFISDMADWGIKAQDALAVIRSDAKEDE